MKKQLSILQTFLVTCLLLVIGGGSSLAQDEVIIWSEDWTGCSAGQQPSEINAMYSQTDISSSKTKIYNEIYAGGKAPELLVTKSGSWTVNISDLKGCYGDVTLSFLSNKTNLSVKANGTKVSLTTSKNQRTGTFSVPKGTTSLTIVFSATENTRIDNVVLKGTNPNVKTFKFSASSCTAMLGAKNNEYPTLTNEYDSPVTYSSSNPDVVTEFKDGTPILKATGTTTITATLNAHNKVTASYVLTVNPLTNSLSFSADGGTYNKAPQIVTLTAGIEGSKIYYTTNGEEPTTESQLYTDGVSVTKNGTVIKALAVADAVANFTATSKVFTIQPDQAVFSVDSKTFKEPLDVELTLPSTTDPTSKIYYAIGSEPNGGSNVYTGTPVRIDSETDGEKITLHAMVCDEYGNWSKESYRTYTKTTAVVFDFTANPNVWEIEPGGNSTSNTDDIDLYVEGVKLNTASTGNYKTCIFDSNTPTLRVYSGGSLTFTAPLGYKISKIVFTGSASFSPSVGTFSNNIWKDATNGYDKVVKLTYKSSTSKIETASVSLVKVTNAESISLPATNNGETYATFSCSRDVIFTEDVIVNAVKVEDGSLVITPLTTDIYETSDATNSELIGYYVPANTGVLISGIENNAKVYYPVANQSVTIDNNQLKPAPINGGMIEAVDGNKYYKLAYSDYINKTGLGFYWGADNGGAFKVKSGTAYLEVPVTLSPAKGFAFGGDETDITNIDANSSNSRVIYNLAGQRISDTVKPGLYIINGKKTVVR